MIVESWAPDAPTSPVVSTTSDPPLPVQVDGFQRALLLEQGAWHDALCAAPTVVRERLAGLAVELYASLRTPIFPKGSYRVVAAALVDAAAQEDRAVDLHCILASPTADVELGAFLACAALFRRHNFTPRVTLHLVQWENLVDVSGLDVPTRERTFARQVCTLTEAVRQFGLAGTIVPISLDVTSEGGEIHGPSDFAAWWRLVATAARDPRRAERTVARDVAWCADFYARQHSLRRLGEQQVLFDLAIRRAVGARVTRTQVAAHEQGGTATLLVTSELHKRFLPCYAVQAPILNIDTRAWSAGVARSA